MADCEVILVVAVIGQGGWEVVFRIGTGLVGWRWEWGAL